MTIQFSKYEGAGNDFLLIDNRKNRFAPQSRLIARLCDRHFGIGADGLMLLDANGPDGCRMEFFNSDGSRGEMCGNGARCFSLFMHHLGIGTDEKHFLATDGPHTAHILSAEGAEALVELGIRPVTAIRELDGGAFSLDTGVPHYVEFVEDIARTDVCGRGRVIRHDTRRFAAGTNVNFAQLLAPSEISMRTYERGVEDETLACGTGATAVALAAHHSGRCPASPVVLHVPGGELTVSFRHDATTQTYNDIRLKGPARRIFEGVLDTNNF